MTILTYLDDLGSYLQTNNMGTIGTDIFYMGLDESVGNCIGITPYGGTEHNNIITGIANLCSPNVQILVRNISASAGLIKATNIYKLLRIVSNLSVGTTFFLSITPVAPPMFVAKTDAGYYLYSVNFNVLLQ